MADDDMLVELPFEQHFHELSCIQLYRGGKVAIYEHTCCGDTVHIIVFIIKVLHKRDDFAETCFFAPICDLRIECFPKLRDYGSSVWTFQNEKSAKVKFWQLVESW